MEQDQNNNAENQQLSSPQQVILEERKIKPDQLKVSQYQVVSKKEGEIIKSSYRKLPRFKKIEIFFEIVGLVTLVLTWVYFKDGYNDLPDQVPVQFDIDGKPITWDNKEFLYAFPGIETILYILITVLQLVPHRFKYNLTINPWNAQDVYRATRILLLYAKITTELMFCYLIFMMLRVMNFEAQPNTMFYVFLFIVPYIVGAARYYCVVKKLTQK